MGTSGQAKKKIKESSGPKPLDIDILNKVRKSICKIIVNKEGRNHYGTGFFMKVSDSLRYLITNYHVINSENLNAKIEIEIWNKKNFILNMNNRNIHYLNLPKDITALEIKDSDDIFEDIEFLSYDKNYEDGYIIYKDADIFTIEHPLGKNASSASGKIVKIYENEFEHNISTENGSSGCPILLLNDNINFIKVIGIHKSADERRKINFGTFIGEIIKKIKKNLEPDLKNELKNEFKNYFNNELITDLMIKLENEIKSEIKKDLQNYSNSELKKDLKKELKNNIENKSKIILKDSIECDLKVLNKKIDNYILAEIYIDDNEVNKDIRIINSYEETTSKESSKDYLFSGEDIRNEKEIKECQIEINDELIPFNYFYQFKNKGKYIIKYFFQNYLKSTVCIFNKCENLICIDLRSFNTSNVTDMSYMFKECKKLKVIIGINKNKATNLNSMFKGCIELEYLDLSKLDNSNVTVLQFIFRDCIKLKIIEGINGLITDKVINVKGMFYGCSELEELDLSNCNTSNIIYMSLMFCNCKNLKEIKGLNKFNTNKVISMSSMFGNCCELESLDLSSFDTSNVTDMSCMFSVCLKLKEIKGINGFITNKVKDMCSMFQQCGELESLDLSNFDTSNVTDMSHMFAVCTKLKYLNLLNFKINGNTEGIFLFTQSKEFNLITNNDELIQLYEKSFCTIF